FEFRGQFEDEVLNSCKRFKDAIRNECGIEEAAMRAGLNKPFDIRLARKQLGKNGARMFAINTDSQLKLEMPSVLSGSDTLQVLVHEIKLFFKAAPVIQVVIDGEEPKHGNPVETFEMKQEDIDDLNKELSVKNSSCIIKGDPVKINFGRGKNMKTGLWPWKVKCGYCETLIMLRPDSKLKGKVSSFDRQHYKQCITKAGKRKSDDLPKKADFFVQKPSKIRKTKPPKPPKEMHKTGIIETVDLIDDNDVYFDDGHLV
uniref:Uncharacterized protein n=2 Tax=Clytia hemisphaerica TaxID=252671 RepID=A0A7M5V033_9CNID